MEIYARGLWAIAFSLFMALGAAPAEAGDRVVLVSWDGIRRDVLYELMHYQPVDATPVACPNARHPAEMPVPCGNYLTCLPNLCRYQLIDSYCVEGKPLTRPQHAQMLTGYGPLETGEITNAGKRAVPPGMTIYERIDTHRDDVTTVHIAGRKFVGRGIIKYAKKGGALDIDTRRGGRDQYTGRNTTRRFEQQMEKFIGGPFFAFIHYKGPDVIAHRSSHKSVQYREAIVQADKQLGALQALIEGAGVLDETEILITTDHGFDGIFHVNGDLGPVTSTWIGSKDNGLMSNFDGIVLDVTPTILQQLGVSTGGIDPPFRGRSLLAGPLP